MYIQICDLVLIKLYRSTVFYKYNEQWSLILGKHGVSVVLQETDII